MCHWENSTIFMAIFNSYVELREGNLAGTWSARQMTWLLPDVAECFKALGTDHTRPDYRGGRSTAHPLAFRGLKGLQNSWNCGSVIPVD